MKRIEEKSTFLDNVVFVTENNEVISGVQSTNQTHESG